MFGEEKSTTAFRAGKESGLAKIVTFPSSALCTTFVSCWAKWEVENVTLMKPGPATEVEANKPFLLFTASTIASASERGFE